ncbi:MAG: hypothetical protein QOJ63_554 [Solirubrobacteraceae bacterium]|jgi:uncharacterized protein (TIGR02677 family)|nr:hypothetical protein [Solirubrobacteraceae bacterium]
MSRAGFDPFSHLTAPNVALYRQIMSAFAEAKQRFVVHLRPEDVCEAIAASRPGVELDAVADALRPLVHWGNLRDDPDTSRVTTVEDFHRPRFLYQLTQEGEAVERALAAYDEHLGRRGSLQAVALADIAAQLRALAALAGQSDPDAARVSLLLRDLVGRFSDLADNAQAFMGSLQRTIDLYDADVDTFRAYKDQLVEYLERFIKDLVTVGAEIAGLLDVLERAGVARLLAIAAARDAEDAAPGALARDDADDPRAAAYEQGLAAWQGRWRGLRQWFVADAGHPSQAKLLRTRARSAIPQLLAVVASLNERRTGRSDRSADFRTLARWFAQAPDDESMHRLWRVSFGVGSSRHLAIDGDTLAAREERPVAASTAWAHAPPLNISPRLRRTGSYERRGRPNRIVDRAEQRHLLEQLAVRQAAETALARARLATGRALRLTELQELDPTAFGLFLTLLGDALGARRPGQREVVTTTTDGTLRVRLISLDGGARAEIRTPAGILCGPDHLIEISDLAGAAGQQPARPELAA